MCGINGLVYKNAENTDVQSIIEKMNQKIIHRGPDEDGFFVEHLEDKTIAFAMRRLSIVDLSTGKQPIFTEDKSKVIVFNGQIYNSEVLKKTLVQKGFAFYTSSPAEVVLKLYECFGLEAFNMLDGVFAFSIYDKILGKIFIARDFFGDKPLHYQHSEKGLIWASELKSIISVLDKKPEIDNMGLNLYFQLTYIPAPFTIYKGISKLESNSFIEYDVNTNALKIHEIHSEKIEKQQVSFDEAKKNVRKLVEESVSSRSVSDVSLGAFLSGGVDSSIISLCLSKQSDSKIDTFSIGFDKKSFDETDKSRLVANLIGSNHHEFVISEKDLTAHLDEILLNFDEPFADSSALPSYIVASKTADYVKVALTGDGGDEVFGGYNKYLIGGINQKYTSLVPRFLHQSVLKVANALTKQKGDERGLKFKVRKALNSIDYDDSFFYNIIKLGFTDEEMSIYLNEKDRVKNPLAYYQQRIPNPKNLTDFRNVDKMISLEGDMIVKVDRTSMLASMECRAPFLTREIWNYTLSLPDEYLLKGNNKKMILKKAFENEFPEQFLEKSKKGFGVPVGDWLRQGMRSELLSYIDDKFLEEQDIFDIQNIKKIVLNHLNSVEDNSFKIWTFYCFQKWYKNTYLATK
ncbi:MAG: asparagine synthase (glutamine-hydrolyzing) [Flavobacteriaceae bacterium]|nr:asparagine synthase (glutamine-hydrolyzing) [Flavobacteriaceae bacterium]